MTKPIVILPCILACLAIFVGCTNPTRLDHPPSTTVTAHPNGGAGAERVYTVALQHAVGSAPYTVACPEIEETIISDCKERRTSREYLCERALSDSLMLDITGLAYDLSSLDAEMEDAIFEAYGIDKSGPRIVRDSLTLATIPDCQTTYRIRWKETWDANALVIHDGERIVATAPFNILTGAKLEVANSESVSCGKAQPTASALAADIDDPVPPKQLAEAQEQTPSNTPVLAKGPTLESASPEALGLVREYVRSLGARQWEQAYELLHPVYRKRVPFDDYVSGYSPVMRIEIRDIAGLRETPYKEIVDAELLITTMHQDVEIESTWRAEYEVMITRGKPPYQRSITAVRMSAIRVD